MDCEKFQLIGLEDPSWLPLAADRAQLAAAIEHSATCSRCAALADYWQEVRSTLHELGESTKSAQAPKRVETQLRYHFSARHRSWWSRSTAMFAAWTLVTATLLLAGVSWWNWRVGHNLPSPTAQNQNPSGTLSDVSDDSQDPTLIADNDPSDFTMLPGSLPLETDDAAIVRVRMQRGALSSLGLPINEDRLSDWIQVDLLVAQDGQPKAVRLPESEQSD